MQLKLRAFSCCKHLFSAVMNPAAAAPMPSILSMHGLAIREQFMSSPPLPW